MLINLNIYRLKIINNKKTTIPGKIQTKLAFNIYLSLFDVEKFEMESYCKLQTLFYQYKLCFFSFWFSTNYIQTSVAASSHRFFFVTYYSRVRLVYLSMVKNIYLIKICVFICVKRVIKGISLWYWITIAVKKWHLLIIIVIISL